MIDLNHKTVNRRPIIDQFGPHHVSTADEERMSEMEQRFEVVRGVTIGFLVIEFFHACA